MDINRQGLIDQLVERHNYTKKAAKCVVDDFADIILYNMEQGNSVSISGFGCFDLLKRAARSCPDPSTGEKCFIPAHWIPRFYPYTGMRRAVKLWEAEHESKKIEL